MAENVGTPLPDDPKCTWLMPDKTPCPEYSVHDGQCEWHMEYSERAEDIGKEMYNVLLRTLPSEEAENIGNMIMRDVIYPAYEVHAAAKIQDVESNRAWVKYRERVKSWRRKLVQRTIDAKRDKENAEAFLEAQKKSRVLDKIVSDRRQQLLVAGARERAKIVAERAFAREAETRLRADFGELAKDLKKTLRHLTFKLGDGNPLLADLHSWRATAEILADKELSDNLDEVRKAPIEDFGPVPRPEWRCFIHPDVEPLNRLDGTKICSDSMCFQVEGGD
jgi:hypothetical protein